MPLRSSRAGGGRGRPASLSNDVRRWSRTRPPAASEALWAVRVHAAGRERLQPTVFERLRQDSVGGAVARGGGWSLPEDHRADRVAEGQGRRPTERRTPSTGLAVRQGCTKLTAGDDACPARGWNIAARAWTQPGTLDDARARTFAATAVRRAGEAVAGGTSGRVLASVADSPRGATAPASREAAVPTLPSGLPSTGVPAVLSPPPHDVTPPAPPAGITVVSSTLTSLALTWAASSDNVGVIGYDVYVNNSLVAAPTSNVYTLINLACGTSYTIAVAAYDAAGNRSTTVTITTSTAACPETQLPSAPTNLVTTFLTQSAVTLSWSASANNAGVAGYRTYLGAFATGTTTQTRYAFSGLSCGRSYTLGVEAYDAEGNRSAVASVVVATLACADTSPPTRPANLVESAATTSGISIAWTAASDNVGVSGYRIFLDGGLAGTTATTSYAVTGLSCGTSHQVVVDAYDAAGNRSPQISATMVTLACLETSFSDTQPPSRPIGLAVASAGSTVVSLTWAAPPNHAGIAGYDVYENGFLVASPTTAAYALMGLTCGTSYSIGVDAYDVAGNRSARSTITTSTAACPGTKPPAAPTNVVLAARTTTSISITWMASTDNVYVAGYDLYVGGKRVGSATATAYTFTGLTCGANYTVSVGAYDAAGNHSPQATTMFSTAACSATVSVPNSVAVTSMTQTSIRLSWAASTASAGIIGYRLYRGGIQIATSNTTNYLFASLACGTSYTLGVAAVDAAGNVSAVSSHVVATAACSVGGVGSGSVWVSPAGSDSTCVRGDQSKPCATPGRACAVAQGGDVILVAAGVYSAGFVLTNCNPVSTVTFENAPGTNVFFAGNSSISGSSNIAIQGDRIGHGVGFSLGFTSISSTTNLVWNNVNLYCQNASPWVQLHSNLTNEDACSSALTIASGTNGFTWNGGDQSDFASCLTSCTHTGSQGNPNDDAITGTATNILIEHVKFHNYFSLDNNGSAGDHSELFVITGGTHVEFLDNSMTDCGPPASTGYAVNNSCNTSLLFFGGSGSANTSNYYTFIQNMIAPGHGQAAVAWDYNVPAGNETTETWKIQLDRRRLVPVRKDIRRTVRPRNRKHNDRHQHALCRKHRTGAKLRRLLFRRNV